MDDLSDLSGFSDLDTVRVLIDEAGLEVATSTDPAFDEMWRAISSKALEPLLGVLIDSGLDGIPRHVVIRDDLGPRGEFRVLHSALGLILDEAEAPIHWIQAGRGIRYVSFRGRIVEAEPDSY